MHIYPNIQINTGIETGPEGVYWNGTMSTWVRKKHRDGKYYLFRVLTRWRERLPQPSSSDVCLALLINEFNRQVYLAQKCQKINPTALDGWDDPIYILDRDQEDELTRIRKKYLPVINT